MPTKQTLPTEPEAITPVTDTEPTVGLDLVDLLLSPKDLQHRLNEGDDVACLIMGRDERGEPGTLAITAATQRLDCRAKILAKCKATNRYRAEITQQPSK